MFSVIHHYHFDAKNGAERPSLYDRLGGVYSIATVVDDFIDRIMVDPRLIANPHRVPPRRQFRRKDCNRQESTEVAALARLPRRSD